MRAGRRIVVALSAVSGLWLLAPSGAAAAGPGPAAESAADAEDGFQPIFDGKSLEGWDGDPKFWKVEDGAITAETTPQNPATRNTFILWRRGELDDFELRLRFRLSTGNSGIQYRSWEEGERWHVAGYQADIEVGSDRTGSLFGEGGGKLLGAGRGDHRGLLAGCGEKAAMGADHERKVLGSVGDAKEILASVKTGDWNEYRIVARRNRHVLEVNGRVTADFTDDDPAAARRGGILALQLHSGGPTKVQFRDIRLKRLKMEDRKKVVLLAGSKSHGYMSHGHNPGCLLLARHLNAGLPSVHAVVYKDARWHEDPTALDNADTIVAFSDGQGVHVLMRHLERVDRVLKRGVGLVLLHYAVEPVGEERREQGGAYFLEWVGGYYEKWYSVNPFWTAHFRSLPDHPIARGVKPFAIDDEWYFNMRFPADMKGVTPILTAVPPDEVRNRPDDAHGGNATVRSQKGRAEHVGWAYERPGGGRGFGFTGGHFHWNWANEGFRKVVLNAIVWTAGLDVPEGGVPTKPVTLDDLKADQDYPAPENFDWEPVKKRIEEWGAAR